jgi:ribonuclease BN (tRNA processing enzyme)
MKIKGSRLWTLVVFMIILSLFIGSCLRTPIVSPSASPSSNPSSLANSKSKLSYAVVDTGQTRCYDNSKEIPSPKQGESFYGQDAQFQGNQPSYKNNGDGTISDLVTGLMWQKTPGAKVTYANAVAGAKTFNLDGYTDWRLPTIKELYSLILFSGKDVSPMMAYGVNADKLVPFLDTNCFDFKYGDTVSGERIIDAQYWSSTQYVSTTMRDDATVFGVNFPDGRIKGYPIQPLRGEFLAFVRYVRGSQNYGTNDFKDNSDSTITDKATELMWAKDDSGKGMNWEESLVWVQKKNSENYLGYHDWRLPNAKEMQSILDYSRSPSTTGSAAINPIFNISDIKDEGGKKNFPFFWTSTTHVDSNDSGAFGVYICFGEALGYMPTSGQRPQGQQPTQGSGSYELMDVHGAGAQRSDPKVGNSADYPYGHGPQGDVVRIQNYARCVRNSDIPVSSVSPASNNFSVIAVGTGGPIYNSKRSGPSALVHYKDNYFLVDMGNGTQAKLNDLGFSLRNLNTVMLTHHHIDHDEEFPGILVGALLTGGKNLNITGPPGTRELYDFTRKFYKEDLSYRAARTGINPDKTVVNIKELVGGENLEINGVNIRTAEVVHTIFTIAYRFDVDEKSIVISGDTAYSENLIQLAKRADILVMDSGGVIMKEDLERNQAISPPRKPSQSGNISPIKAHASLEEIATMAEKAEVKRLVLTHFAGPGDVDTAATVKAISSIYEGEVLFSYDLMEVICQ